MKYFSVDLTGILACLPLTSKVINLFTNCSGGLLSRCSYYITQDKQWTYHVTLIRVRVTIVAAKNRKCYMFWVFVCSLTYPACKPHAPLLYYHQCPVRLYHIFPH